MKLHISLKVEDLDNSIRFYSTLFSKKPDIVRDDYAKWDVEDPPVNFVIESGRGETGLDHVGIQADNPEQLDDLVHRIRKSDQPQLDLESTTCCYAKSDKAWVRGTAGERWEAFLTHSHDSEEYGQDSAHLLPAE
ncbi:MAG: glyoxalase/bleomycin resistance/dioxygenase family protein [Gammaproteobacteria bacterium]|nr:glyoxalase/bleomycin resistance/dioxygenase family protein [Gammaproteobacteria bacterium]MYD75256.1 glyoxalase/bleomycin resistance/dioxygenase family protein [Gammaproteobacteria bacterium]MYJ52728.1 glyoxalase/bleomycin resistance/dioxygenase family protein [Gammaproteobacteria bacterium]